MDIELLIIPGCPNSGPARDLFARALALEGLDPELITVREISTDADAKVQSFRGSPTFRIAGMDIFPSTAEPAVACRVYPTAGGLSGEPSLESLRHAIRTHAQSRKGLLNPG